MKISDIKKITDQLNKDHKSELFIVLGDPTSGKIEIERVPCGRLSIDIPIGGGFPVGRIIEIYGPESSGKTTIALHAIAAFQKAFPKKAVAFVDYEHSFDPAYAKNLGLNTDELILSQPMHMEQGLQGIDKLIDTGNVSAIVIDSVAAMVPEKELAGDMGVSSVGVHAKQMSQAMRKLVGKAHRTGTTLFFINQLREKIGIMFGSPETTTGGKALKFYASIRLDVRAGVKQKDKEGFIISSRGRMKVVKNKTYPPFKNSEFDMAFGTGVSRVSDILDYGEMAGIFLKKGSWYSLAEDGVKMGQGKEAAIAFLEEQTAITDEAEQILLDSLI